MNILLSTGGMNFTDQQIEKIKHIDSDVNLWIQDDERNPIKHDISKIEYLITFSLLNRYNLDDFTSLKYVQALSAGLDNFPQKKLKQKNIPLFNARGVYSAPIAEFVLLRALQIYKRSRYFDENQKNEDWKKARNLLELTNKRVAIIGYGDIGNEVAKRFSAFGSKIISFSRSKKESEFIDEQYNISEIEDVISTCDINVVCVPHNDETHEMFNSKLFSCMKDNSAFINISRGKVVNENDLISYIEKDKFLGVALDVTYQEPLAKGNKLWEFENVFISPHNSFNSDVIEQRLFEKVYEHLLNAHNK